MGLKSQLHPEHPEILSVGNALGDNAVMNCVLKTRSFVLKTRDCVLKTRNFCI